MHFIEGILMGLGLYSAVAGGSAYRGDKKVTVDTPALIEAGVVAVVGGILAVLL